jgi:hypothetical protein
MLKAKRPRDFIRPTGLPIACLGFHRPPLLPSVVRIHHHRDGVVLAVPEGAAKRALPAAAAGGAIGHFPLCRPAPADPGFTGVFVGVVVEFSADGDVRAEKGLVCVDAAAGDGLGRLGLLGVCWVLLPGVGGRPDGGLSANTPACNGLC